MAKNMLVYIKLLRRLEGGIIQEITLLVSSFLEPLIIEK
jgi:hypothetical protein